MISSLFYLLGEIIMKEIYLLTHHRKYEDGSGSDIKLLGTYSSLEEIEKVLPHYRKQPGFCDYIVCVIFTK